MILYHDKAPPCLIEFAIILMVSFMAGYILYWWKIEIPAAAFCFFGFLVNYLYVWNEFR